MDTLHAMSVAKKAHGNQKDDNGLPYFEEHCLQVYRILSSITDDEAILMAGILHDTIEDTELTHEDLKEEFGEEVADLVNEVTHEGQKDEYGFYFPRLKTKKGILIKFADRLSNLSRMQTWSEKRKEHYLKKSKFWKS